MEVLLALFMKNTGPTICEFKLNMLEAAQNVNLIIDTGYNPNCAKTQLGRGQGSGITGKGTL
jgi:hypothetical protein